MEKMGRNVLFVLLWVFSGLVAPALALEVLEPGYIVETYAAYACPEMQVAPSGITFDSYGNLYLTQWEDYPSIGGIYRISPDKSAMKWVDGLGTPRKMVWTGGTEYGDYLYVTDATPRDLLRIELDGTVSTFCHVGAGPHALALDRTGAYGGYLYLAAFQGPSTQAGRRQRELQVRDFYLQGSTEGVERWDSGPLQRLRVEDVTHPVEEQRVHH